MIPLRAAAGRGGAGCRGSAAYAALALVVCVPWVNGSAVCAAQSVASEQASAERALVHRPESLLGARQEPLVTDAGRAFVLSALIPGAGQWQLGVERWVPYAALEAWALATYLERRSRGRVLAKQYRDVAWAVARRVSVGNRRDGDWGYYEAMEKYHSSGVLDADPRAPGIQPERDQSTYNGHIWLLARAIHVPGGAPVSEVSPEYQRALEYYARRAVPPEMAWSWGDNGLEQQIYRELIRDSDEAFRASTRALGVVLANHVISAVDALITARMRADSAANLDWDVRGSIEPDARSGRWRATVRFSWR